MKFKAENVFLVTGYMGDKPLPENIFMGYCVARDVNDAALYMRRLMMGLNVTAVTSLPQMRAVSEMLEGVLKGSVDAPITDAMYASGV